MKRNIEISALVGMIISIAFACFWGFENSCEGIREDVFRLHILANSDSEYDQSLKLKVRDRVIEMSEELWGDSESRETAELSARDNLCRIREESERVLRENGCNYPVKCELLNMNFDSRTYGDIVMPAGNYDTLRITIGNAEGKNWWCVMYPPLCIPAAFADDYFTEEELDLLENSPRYEIKFKFLELWEKLLDFIDLYLFSLYKPLWLIYN